MPAGNSSRHDRKMRKTAAYLAAALCAALLTGGAAADPADLAGVIAEPNPFSALVGKKRERRADRTARVEAERYVLASDNRVFLFENRSNEARVKFLCGPDDPRIDCTLDPDGPAPEIYLLTETRGPRGDLFYKNAQGQTMLRIASYGGATVHWPGEEQGLAASKSFGDDAGLRLDRADIAVAQRRARAATDIISTLTGVQIEFDINPAPQGEQVETVVLAVRPGPDLAGLASFADAAPPVVETPDAAVLADAVMRAAKGLKAVADDPTGARILAHRIKQVSFAASLEPGVEFADGVLTIRYVPDRDVAGRPSSAAITRFLEESL